MQIKFYYNYTDKVWWICKDFNHNYQMAPKQRVYYHKRHMKACPYCKGLRQEKLHFFEIIGNFINEVPYNKVQNIYFCSLKFSTFNENKVHKSLFFEEIFFNIWRERRCYFFPQLHLIPSTPSSLILNSSIVLFRSINIAMP